MASVEFQHIDKIYPGGTRALSDCSLRIDDGELMVLVGPSGCGKSTLLRLLAGLDQATSGAIRIGDRLVNDLPPQERNIAMVFQDYALYPFMSVRRNLEFPLKMRKLPREEMQRRVDWAAGLLDIAPLLDRLPKQLSGGQRQRVAMGRALVRQPTVFLLDEPLSNLDAKLRVQVRAEIGELQQRTRTTMLYVTHDQVEAMTLGHRVAVLDKGVLQQVAPPGELYDRPANLFVAGFIGNPPMNVFPTRVTLDGHGRAAMRLGAQLVPIAPPGLSAEQLRRREGAALTGGVRPEALRLASNESADGAVQAAVEHVESLGHETLLYVRVDDTLRLIARAPGMLSIGKDDRLSLLIDPTQAHLFDETGKSLAD